MDIGKCLDEAARMHAPLRTTFRDLIAEEPGFLDVPIEKRVTVALLQAAHMLEADGSGDPFADIASLAVTFRAELQARVAAKGSEGE